MSSSSLSDPLWVHQPCPRAAPQWVSHHGTFIEILDADGENLGRFSFSISGDLLKRHSFPPCWLIHLSVSQLSTEAAELFSTSIWGEGWLLKNTWKNCQFSPCCLVYATEAEHIKYSSDAVRLNVPHWSCLAHLIQECCLRWAVQPPLSPTFQFMQR